MSFNKDNFILFAMKCYDNPSCSGIKEFYDDIKRFQYVRKSLRRKQNNKIFNLKLTLNHLITLYNIFGIKATEMLFFKVDKELWIYLKPFIVFLNYMPKRMSFDNQTILSSDIPMDEDIVNELRKI